MLKQKDYREKLANKTNTAAQIKLQKRENNLHSDLNSKSQIRIDSLSPIKNSRNNRDGLSANKTVGYSSTEKKLKSSKSIQNNSNALKEAIYDATLKESKKITKLFKEQKLKQRILERGGLYPKEYSHIDNRSESSILKQRDVENYDNFSRSAYGLDENKTYNTVIREASLFERVSEDEMMAQPLSEETILMDDIIISRFSKYKTTSKEMLRKLADMMKNHGRNIDSNSSFESIFNNNNQNNYLIRDNSSLIKTMKSLPLKSKPINRIPYLKVK